MKLKLVIQELVVQLPIIIVVRILLVYIYFFKNSKVSMKIHFQIPGGYESIIQRYLNTSTGTGTGTTGTGTGCSGINYMIYLEVEHTISSN